MFCGLPSLKVLLSSILPAKDKDMVTSPSSSSSKSFRRQSCTTFNPESPSQNTRAAKKRRLKQQLHSKPVEVVSADKNNDLATMAASAQILASNPEPMSFVHPNSHFSSLQQAPLQVQNNLYHFAAQTQPPQLLPHDVVGSSPSYTFHNVFDPGHDSGLYHAMDHSAFSSYQQLAPPLPHEILQTYPPQHAQVDVVMGNTGENEKGATHQEVVDLEMRDPGEAETRLDNKLQRALKASMNHTAEPASKSPDQNDRSYFMEMPVEIRREIFKHIVPQVIGRPYTRDATNTVAWVKGNIDLVAVNKQIFHETMDYMWNNLVVEFDVNNTGVSHNFTAKAGNALQPKSKSCGGDMAQLTIPIERARNVVINVPDVQSLEDWESLVKHQTAVRTDGAIALKPHLEKLINRLAEAGQKLQHVQVNLRDWDEPVESAFALLTPLLTGVKAASSITVYQQSDFEDWPWTNMEIMNEWQVQNKSESVKKWVLTMENGTPRATLVVRPPPPPKPKVKKEDKDDQEDAEIRA
jgi:hypothetical protein